MDQLYATVDKFAAKILENSGPLGTNDEDGEFVIRRVLDALENELSDSVLKRRISWRYQLVKLKGVPETQLILTMLNSGSMEDWDNILRIVITVPEVSRTVRTIFNPAILQNSVNPMRVAQEVVKNLYAGVAEELFRQARMAVPHIEALHDTIVDGAVMVIHAASGQMQEANPPNEYHKEPGEASTYWDFGKDYGNAIVSMRQLLDLEATSHTDKRATQEAWKRFSLAVDASVTKSSSQRGDE